jgi:lipopolysaccharide export system ATP-binding protein
MIVGLIPVDNGAIHLNRQELSHERIHNRAQLGIGYLPQEASIFRKLSVEDNIYAIVETRDDLNGVAKSALLEKLLNDFNITHIRKSLGLSLSGGERRRVEIARALAMEPKFILLDEPFAGVDPISVIDIQVIIKSLAERGIGVLITDHNVRETLNVCERAYIFNEGEVIAKGTPKEILANKKVLNVYLGNDFKL